MSDYEQTEHFFVARQECLLRVVARHALGMTSHSKTIVPFYSLPVSLGGPES